MTRRGFRCCLATLLPALLVSLSGNGDPIEKYDELPAAPWSLASGDVDGDGTDECVYGAIDNGLYVWDNGENRKVGDVGGYAFDIVCLDVDGDGQEEIVCAVADYPSHVYCFRADGTLLWKQAVELCCTALQQGRNAELCAKLVALARHHREQHHRQPP